MNNQPRSKDRPATANHGRSGKIGPGTIGCLGIVGILVVAVILGAIMDTVGPTITITGDSGSIHHKVNSLDTAELAGYSVAQNVYEAATKHPELKSLSIELEMEVAGGAVDSYGNEVKGPLIMGVISIKNLDEVRKYADRVSYASRNSALFGIEISLMKHSHLLSK